MKKFVFFMFFLLAIASLNAKDSLKLSFGIYAGAAYNLHQPDFTLSNPDYYSEDRSSLLNFNENGNSFGFYAGGIINYPITEMFTISGRLGYNFMNGILENDYTATGGVDTTFTSEIEASLSYFEISPILQVHNLIENNPLYLLGGFEIGIPVTNNYKFTDQVQASENIDLSLVDEVNREYADEDIPDAATRIAFAVGAGYTFDLSDNIHLSPEISFRFPFTGISSADEFDSWSAPQLRLGVNLTFSLGDEKEPLAEQPKYYLDLAFDEINYFDEARQPKKIDNIKVEEVQYTELFPLVPYVFFEEMKSEPREDIYQAASESSAGVFKIENLSPSALEINSKTLDIIGARMQEDESIKISLSGTLDEKNEKGNIDIARNRAEYIKNYLIVNFGISPNRIETIALENPTKPSSSRVEEGNEENRRVEISSNKKELLEPILLEYDRQRIAEPEQIQFVPSAETNDTIISWELEIMQAGRLLRKYSGVNEPGVQNWNIKPNELAESDVPVDYTLTALTKSGIEETISGSIPVEYFSFTRKKQEEKTDKVISKFSLILFDFNSPEISDKDQEILNKNVIPAIEYNSTVQIYGYTDRIGTESYNSRLALQRAENVKKILVNKAPDATYEVYGVGENVEIYDNNSPVGRQLSRTVQVYVITPKE